MSQRTFASKLISTTIPHHHHGHYDWYENEWLTIHESFRREFLRAERAIKNMSISKNNWQMNNLYHWMNNYFLPCLSIHIRAKIDIIVTYYESLNEVFEFDTTYVVLLLLNGIEEKVKELYYVIYGVKDISQVLAAGQLTIKVKELVDSFVIFKDYCFNYMDEQVSNNCLFQNN